MKRQAFMYHAIGQNVSPARLGRYSRKHEQWTTDLETLLLVNVDPGGRAA
jgi:hypothetical protein